jgi:hypothetical protein
MSESKIGGASFESTIGALRQGVLNVAVRRAANEVGFWQERLQGSGDAVLEPIGENLALLRGELEREEVDPLAVGGILNELGEQVGKAASEDYPPAVSDNLQQLADLLKSGADTLANAAPNNA